MTELMSEKLAVAAVIDPDANAAGTITSGWVSMAIYVQIMAVIMAGDLGSSATIDAKLQQAKDSSGTGAKDIAGKAITQLTQAGTDKSNTQQVINVRAEELDRNNGYGFVRLSLTTSTATSDSGAIIIGSHGRYSPVAQPAAVGQVVI